MRQCSLGRGEGRHLRGAVLHELDPHHEPHPADVPDDRVLCSEAVETLRQVGTDL